MPSSTEILNQLTAMADEWRLVAIAWHAFLGALVGCLISGWRPSTRLVGRLLVLPLASVAAFAWMAANMFNAVIFAALAVTLAVPALRVPIQSIRVTPPSLAIPGGILVAFGWIYPHFLKTDSWISYLYEAPLGIVPCPTLSAVIGVALIVGLIDLRAWSVVLAIAAAFYGGVGVFGLGVRIDVFLLAAAVLLAGVVLRQRHVMQKGLESTWGALQIAFEIVLGPVRHRWRTRWGATADEIARTMPGDEVVPRPTWTYNHAITIDAPRSAIWPWLVQLGQARGGFYSYEGLENLVGCDIHNVLEIRPQLQRLRVGETIRMHRSGFGPQVMILDGERALVLGGPPDAAGSQATWSFYLCDAAGGSTRLIERGRGLKGRGMLAALGFGPYLIDPVGFVMSRKMLRTIKRLAEGPEARPARP